jgi:hypothetical protein
MSSRAIRNRTPSTRRVRPRLEQLDERSLPGNFGITALARLGAPAPGPEGGTFFFDFELGGLSNNGQAVFTADLSQDGVNDVGEGIFLAGKDGVKQVIREGESAPGGGTFGGFGSLSPDAINDAGDLAFGFGNDPFTTPAGTNAGLYRYDHATGAVTAVVVSNVTPVPGTAGDTFAGIGFHPAMNNNGDLVFTGIVPANVGPGASVGLGEGIFLADKHNHLSSVVRPGDPAPGGSTFDFAQNPSINDRGDIGFGAHVASDPVIDLGQKLPNFIFAAESVYVKDHATGAIRSIAHQGGAIPASAGGGTFDYAYGPALNNRGDILFSAGINGTTAPTGQDAQGVFLVTKGGMIAIARPGTAVPGGTVASTSFNVGNYSINNRGDVAFSALLTNGDQAVYVWSNGTTKLVAKSGTVVPGVGTIHDMDEYGTGLPNAWLSMNDRGQVGFGATLEGGGVALLLATP